MQGCTGVVCKSRVKENSLQKIGFVIAGGYGDPLFLQEDDIGLFE